MKTRIVTDDNYFYIQTLEWIPDSSGCLDMSREEWTFLREGFFFRKKKFNYQKEAEDYIEGTKKFEVGYRVVKEFNK